MGYGLPAGVLAGHAVVLLAAAVTVPRMMRLYAAPLDEAKARALDSMPLAAAMIMVVAVVEALYYGTARALVSLGIDLWQAWPAPYLLRLCVALAIYWHMQAYFVWRGLATGAARRRIVAEIALFLGLWGLMFGVLY